MSKPHDDATDDRGHAEFARRVHRLPGLVADALESVDVLELPTPTRLEGRWVITGTGVSDDPARFLEHALSIGLGLDARRVPLSSVDEACAKASVLVVFSQGLSPNARVALHRPLRETATVLFTGSTSRDEQTPHAERVRGIRARGATVVEHHVEREAGLFIRVSGPALARVAAAAFTLKVAERLSLTAPWLMSDVQALCRSLRGIDASSGHAARSTLVESWRAGHALAFVTVGDGEPFGRALAWKALEVLGGAEIPSWDALQFAHGPLQAIYDRAACIVVLRTENDTRAKLLCERMTQCLSPARHRVVELCVTAPSPLDIFEYDALWLRCLVEMHAVRGIDLRNWPARERDAPLYDIENLPRRDD